MLQSAGHRKHNAATHWQAFTVAFRSNGKIERQHGAIAMNTDNLSEAKGIATALAIGLGLWGTIIAIAFILSR
jgi:hypothetical protein